MATVLAASGAAARDAGSGLGSAGCAPIPVIDADFPDPDVLYDPAAGGAFAYSTNVIGAGPGVAMNIPVSRSSDPRLAHWSAMTEALPRLPGWAAAGHTWAPAVARRGGGPYRLYFTARQASTGRQCIGVAVSASPTGPFTPTDAVKPLVCPLGRGGAIDPSVFRDDDGTEYLLWKTDANCCDGVTEIYIQKLSADGLSLVGPHPADTQWLLPDATPLITADQPWEKSIVEGPMMLKHGGRYYLFYSGGDFATRDYAVGYATSRSLFGPFRKATAPMLSSATRGLAGPGGQAIFSGPDGASWIAYHAWRGSGSQRFRALHLGRLVWTSGGPTVVTPCGGGGATLTATRQTVMSTQLR